MWAAVSPLFYTFTTEGATIPIIVKMRQRLGIAPRAKIRVIRRAAFAKLVGRVAGVSRTNVTAGRNDNRTNAKLEFSRREMKKREKANPKRVTSGSSLHHYTLIMCKFLNSAEKRKIFSFSIWISQISMQHPFLITWKNGFNFYLIPFYILLYLLNLLRVLN